VVHRALTLFEQHDVKFVSLGESFDTSTATGRAMLKLVLVFAELEREQTAERTKAAMRARAERGLWNGGPPPLGYDSLNNGHLAINEREADIVRLVYEKFIELRSVPKVAAWLNEHGHRQKKFRSRRKGMTGGKAYSFATVRNLIQNPLYIGKVTHKDDVFDGAHKPIVSKKDFDRAQRILVGNAKNRRGPALRSMHDYPLVGLLRCACGYALTTSAGTSRSGKIHHYYRCVGLGKERGTGVR
jgi:site-specific DNA recombinase